MMKATMRRGWATACAAALVLCSAHSGAGASESTDAGRTMNAGPVPVEIVREGEGKYTLLRGGKPYLIKGAGLDLQDMQTFAAHGGNSIRTWRTDNGQQLLDAAQKLGITVLMCIEIGRERLGFDYNDRAAVQAQLEYARGEVLKYKDHPALLGWMIGNEPDLKFTNPAVFDAINDISRMIHAEDGKHPTTTALSRFNHEMATLLDQRAADLDFVSIQLYGDILNLPRYIRETGLTRPYLVTEWGGVGYWKDEARWTSWNAPIEPNSSEKAGHFRLAYRTAIASGPGQLAGSYVFLWGHKHERTPTWFGMLLEDGAETESVEVAHAIWNGREPDNRAPRIAGMHIDGRTVSQDVVLEPGRSYAAEITASDPDGDALRYRWILKRESEATQEGGDAEPIPPEVPGRLSGTDGAVIRMNAPDQAGAYRLFVYVYDGRGYAGYANIPFLVRLQDPHP